MVENVPPELVRFLLPFAVPAKDRQKRFTEKMEKAAILCLAELERQKGEGFILKKQPEKIGFIAEACYPIWLVPWRKKTLFFDGLGIMTHTFSYAILPDVKTFINNIEGGTGNHEAYLAFLSDNLNYFQGFTEEEEKTIKGLVTSPDFIRDFTSYLSLAKKIRKSIPNKIFLSPTLDESESSFSIKEISKLRDRLTQDIADLHEAMRLLNNTAKKYVKHFQGEIGKVRKRFDKKIAVLKPSVMKKIRKIQKEYDKRILLVSRDIERQLHLLHQEYIKLEKTKQRKVANIDRCEAEIKSCRLRKDETGELRWRRDIENCRKEISALDKSLKDLEKKIKNIESMKKVEISKIRAECDKEADGVMEDIREIEASRDAKIQIIQKETDSLQDLTSQIIEQINKLVELKSQTINNLDQVGLQKRRRTYALTYIPFYLACYQTRSKRRYITYPPSTAGSMGILTKFKGVFGVAKTKSLLQFRSKPVTNLINQTVVLLEKNPVFEKEIHDAGIESNILRTKESKRRLKKGLEELKDEEWISESEFEVFTKPLAKAPQ
jgi:hypothetical protein